MKKTLLITPLFLLIISHAGTSYGQDYTFSDFVGTWHGYISSELYGGYNDPITMIIEPDGFYTETSGHLMPTIYPNTQQCDYEAETNRMHFWWLQTVYAGQYFYQHVYHEVVYFNNDTLEMHYNFWDDPEPWPEAQKIVVVRENATPSPANLAALNQSEEITLYWDDPAEIPDEVELYGYNIYHQFESDAFEIIDFVEVTSFSYMHNYQYGDHRFYVTALYDAGESNPSNEVEVTVSITAAFTANQTSVCEGATVNFTDVTPGNITSWSWTFEGGTPAYSNEQNPSVVYQTAGTYDVTLQVASGNNSDMFTQYGYITVIAPMVYSVSGGGSYCEGTYGVAIALDGSEVEVNYELYKDGVTTGITMMGTGLAISFENTSGEGSYTVMATSTVAPCEVLMNGSVQVIQLLNPETPLPPSGPAYIDIFYNETTQYTASGSQNADAYEWNLDPAEAGTLYVVNENTVEITWNNDFLGTADLRVRGINECGQGDWSSPITVTINNTVDVPETSAIGVIDVFPNPTRGLIRLEVGSTSEKLATWRIMDVTGVVLQQEDNILLNGDYTRTIDLSDLPNGIYFLYLESNDTYEIRKIQVLR